MKVKLLALLGISFCMFSSVVMSTNDTTTYLYGNYQNSTVVKADANGDLLDSIFYEPNGAADSVGGEYTGHRTDQNTNLIYMGARWYDPIIRRFLSKDPVPENLSSTISLNRYAYANNSPYRYTDPTGGIPVDTVWDAISIVYDVGKIGVGYVLDNPKLISDGAVDLAADTTAFFIPYVPAGATKVIRWTDVTKGAGKFSRSPKSIQDQMTLRAAKEGQGNVIIKNLSDPKFKGMEKMELKNKSGNGNDSVVHYVRDPRTGNLTDFKFKKHSVDQIKPWGNDPAVPPGR